LNGSQASAPSLRALCLGGELLRSQLPQTLHPKYAANQIVAQNINFRDVITEYWGEKIDLK
jgi:hypothetical protein